MTSSNNNNNSQLMDPKLALPPEMFSQLLSFLNPTEICTTSETCKSWREAINSNPVLHQEIDLSRLDWFAQTDYFLQTFQRLSALALNRPFKITLNLSSFYRDWIKWIESRSSAPFQRLDELLSSVQTSSEQLQEVSILIVPRLDARDSLPFLLPLVYQLFEYPEMRRISIEAPTLVKLKAGSSCSKSFDIKSNAVELEEDPPGLPLFLKRVKQFVGSSLVEFEKSGDPLVADASGIWEELSDSKHTLKRLCLDSNNFSQSPKEVWEFGWSCNNLEDLDLQFYNRDRDEDDSDEEENQEEEEGEKLEIKKGLDKTVGLNNFKLLVGKHQINWENVPDRIGNVLEKLEISMRSCTRAGDLVTSDALNLILSNSRNTLKVIQLKGFSSEVDKDLAMNWSTSFPHLEELSLYNVEIPLLRYFSRLISPRLQKLGLKCDKAQNKVIPQEMFQCLLELSKLYGSELTQLRFTNATQISIQLPPSDLFSFNYTKMRSLSIRCKNESLEDWLSNFYDLEKLEEKRKIGMASWESIGWRGLG